jgi:hypothetical protein
VVGVETGGHGVPVDGIPAVFDLREVVPGVVVPGVVVFGVPGVPGNAPQGDPPGVV